MRACARCMHARRGWRAFMRVRCRRCSMPRAAARGALGRMWPTDVCLCLPGARLQVARALHAAAYATAADAAAAMGSESAAGPPSESQAARRLRLQVRHAHISASPPTSTSASTIPWHRLRWRVVPCSPAAAAHPTHMPLGPACLPVRFSHAARHEEARAALQLPGKRTNPPIKAHITSSPASTHARTRLHAPHHPHGWLGQHAMPCAIWHTVFEARQAPPTCIYVLYITPWPAVPPPYCTARPWSFRRCTHSCPRRSRRPRACWRRWSGEHEQQGRPALLLHRNTKRAVPVRCTARNAVLVYLYVWRQRACWRGWSGAQVRRCRPAAMMQDRTASASSPRKRKDSHARAHAHARRP